MASAYQIPFPRAVFYDANGNPLAAGLVYTYIANTTTPKTTWQDSGQVTPNSNPIVLDSNGSCLLYGTGTYTLVVTDALGNNIPAYSGLTTTFEPTTLFTTISSLRSNTQSGSILGSVYVEGYSAAADGGQGMFIYVSTDSSSVDNGGTIIVDALNQRWYRDTQTEALSVKWFGATGNGVTDDTTAIQATITAAEGGGAVWYPGPAVYIVSSTLTSSKSISMYGSVFADNNAENGAIIKTTSATAPVITLSGIFNEVYSLGFVSSVTRTAGAYINIPSGGGYTNVHDIYMTGFFYGLEMAGTALRFSDSYLLGGASTSSVGVLINNSANDVVLRGLLIEGAALQNLQAGVQITQCGDVTLDRVSVIWGGAGLQINPPSGQDCQLIMVRNCEFDTGTGSGIDVEATGTVQLLKISDTWCASNSGYGICLNTISSGAIQQTDIINTMASNNTLDGLIINTANVTNTNIIGCSFSANQAAGIFVTGNVSKFKIIGCTCGNSGEFAGNGTYGIVIGTGVDIFTIASNNLTGNTTAGMSQGTATPNWGVTAWITQNNGYVTHSAGQLTTTSGPSSFTVAHGLGCTPVLQDVVLTPLTLLGSASNYYVSVTSSTTFTVAFNTAPGASVVLGWIVRSEGA